MYDSTNSENTDRIYHEMVQCERHMRHVRVVFVSSHLYINIRSQYTNFAKATSINEFCTRFFGFWYGKLFSLFSRSLFLSVFECEWLYTNFPFVRFDGVILKRIPCSVLFHSICCSVHHSMQTKEKAHIPKGVFGEWAGILYAPSFKYFHSFHKVSSAKCSINKAPASASATATESEWKSV